MNNILEFCTKPLMGFSSSPESQVSMFSLSTGEESERVLRKNGIICITEGICEIRSLSFPELVMKKGQVLFLPQKTHYKLICRKNSKGILIHTNPILRLEEMDMIGELYQTRSPAPPDKLILEFNRILEIYFTHLSNYIQDGFTSPDLFEVKTKELFFILSKYYNPEELYLFFYPVLQENADFVQFVCNHWHSVKSVREFTILAGCSENEFRRKFDQAFETSASKWFRQKRKEAVYSAIRNTNENLSGIAVKYRFENEQQFKNFCVRNFKQTPAAIRKNRY